MGEPSNVGRELINALSYLKVTPSPMLMLTLVCLMLPMGLVESKSVLLGACCSAIAFDPSSSWLPTLKFTWE